MPTALVGLTVGEVSDGTKELVSGVDVTKVNLVELAVEARRLGEGNTVRAILRQAQAEAKPLQVMVGLAGCTQRFILDGGDDTGGDDPGAPLGVDADFEVALGVLDADSVFGLAILGVVLAADEGAAADGVRQIAFNRGVNKLGGGDPLAGS